MTNIAAMPSDNTYSRGFTLIELLVALMVFSLLAMAGYRGLNSVLQTRAHLDRETRKYESIARLFLRLDGEVAQALARPVRLPSGIAQAAWVGFSQETSGLEDAQLIFTRAGGEDAEGLPITPQRVGYRLRNNRIQLLRWPRLDQAPNSQPTVDTLLEGVKEFNLRYMTPAFTFEKQWPANGVNAVLPKGMEVELVMLSGEKVVRFFSLQ